MQIFDDAIQNFENGLQINPTHLGCLVGIANTAIKIKNYELASNFLNEIEKIYPDNQIFEKMSQIFRLILIEKKFLRKIRTKNLSLLYR